MDELVTNQAEVYIYYVLGFPIFYQLSNTTENYMPTIHFYINSFYTFSGTQGKFTSM